MFKLSNDQRRFLLARSITFMMIFAAIMLCGLFLASLFRSNPALDEVKVFSLADLKYGQARLLDWHGKKLWLVKRRRDQVSALRELDNLVSDAWSKLKPLPKDVNYLHRGLLPDYLLVFAKGDQCQVQPVSDGFQEPCTGMQYDISGRILMASDKTGVAEHLRVPAYRIVGAKLLVGDEPK